jgi:hypothetical protein
MSVAEQRMWRLLSEAGNWGLLADDLLELLHAAMRGSPVESVMRIRALAELSAHTDVPTLIALAAASTGQSELSSDLVSSLGRRRH